MPLWLWAAFFGLILAFLALDLGVFHRRSHELRFREALTWTIVWIVAALGFTGFVHFLYEHWQPAGPTPPDLLRGRAAMQFFAAYLVEKSLSLDNLFVIAVIFQYFRVPVAYQHRVLFWGIVGALVMRGAMIAAGVVLIQKFSWTTYLFGGLLILTALKMLLMRHDGVEPERNPLVRLARKIFPVTSQFDGDRLIVQRDGRWWLTPLMITLLVIESTDLLFAVDSIPAVFAVTREPFIVFTSNVFAILGLRALFFVLAGALQQFAYLKHALVLLLLFVGAKMLLVHQVKIPTGVSLGVIAAIIAGGVAASLVFGNRRDAQEQAAVAPSAR